MKALPHPVFMKDNSMLAHFMHVVALHELYDHLYWSTVGWIDDTHDPALYIKCSDLFVWGSADIEPVETMEDVELLDQSCKDAPDDGPELYCARRRKMRPQGAFYRHFNPAAHMLFDACGPERPVGLGNPHGRR